MARSTVIPFRLRPGRDSDIIEALNGIPKEIDRSEVIRSALRHYFNLTGVNTLPLPEKRTSELPREFKPITSVNLLATEKSAEDLDADIDSLLSDF